MSKYMIIYILVINVVSSLSMGIDKHKAIKGQWRIPEKWLFLWVVLGGGIGGTVGMYEFHHKTRHWYFRIFFPLIALLEYGLLIYWLVSLFAVGVK